MSGAPRRQHPTQRQKQDQGACGVGGDAVGVDNALTPGWIAANGGTWTLRNCPPRRRCWRRIGRCMGAAMLTASSAAAATAAAVSQLGGDTNCTACAHSAPPSQTPAAAQTPAAPTAPTVAAADGGNTCGGTMPAADKGGWGRPADVNERGHDGANDASDAVPAVVRVLDRMLHPGPLPSDGPFQLPVRVREMSKKAVTTCDR